jgi:hypothetical protein
METLTLEYTAADGWSRTLPVDMDGPQTLVLVFGAPELAADSRCWAELSAAFAQATCLGCSTAGEIVGSEVRDASLGIAITRFGATHLRSAGVAVDAAVPAGDLGRQLAQQLAAPDLCAVFVLSDGLAVNGSALVEGLSQALPAHVVVTGGLAADGSRFAQTWTWDGTAPTPGRVQAVGFYGQNLRIGHGWGSGWSDFGPERRITRAQDNKLFELDGKPALDLYRHYLGERAGELPGAALLFPLSIRPRAGSDEVLVRTILAIDDGQRSMTFAGDMPEGAVARLMRARNDDLITHAMQAARQANGDHLTHGDGALLISVSCVGRRLVLGERVDEEVELVLEGAPSGVPHVGFYSYGEISPARDGGPAELHNQTMTVTLISEV